MATGAAQRRQRRVELRARPADLGPRLLRRWVKANCAWGQIILAIAAIRGECKPDIAQLVEITARQRSGASLPATVFDRSGGNVLANGQLSTLDNTIDTSTGTVKAKARFDNGSGALYPNQFVNVRMLVDVLCNAIVVPATAVRHRTRPSAGSAGPADTSTDTGGSYVATCGGPNAGLPLHPPG